MSNSPERAAVVAVHTLTNGPGDDSVRADDLSNLSHAELIQRVTSLETRLKTTTAQLTALTSSAQSQHIPVVDDNIAARPSTASKDGSQPESTSTPATTISAGTTAAAAAVNKVKVKKQPKPFDLSQYTTRHIALKFSYIGGPYNGYEHSNNTTSAPQKPTIEEVLWKALRKTRLINPIIPEGADQSYDVVWDERERAKRYGVGTEGFGRGKRGKERLELVWDGMAYSKCGRTDKGVSAFGQVIGITVRSNRPTKKRKRNVTNEGQPETISNATVDDASNPDIIASSDSQRIKNDQTIGEEQDIDDEDDPAAEWDSIRDELPYISVLNGVLPPTIRILAWCPHPPSKFDARFSCQERRYKYFFTNPAMCPTPGSLGLKTASGKDTTLRDGWLDIDAMRKAAKKLEGMHDYRNLCKIDSSKQMSNCQRRITFADVEEFQGGTDALVNDTRLNSDESALGGLSMAKQILDSVVGTGSKANGPKVYTFCVNGTAFLWHQVRCMVAILFLVGQRLEEPDIVDKLLDIDQTPRRPHYEMADDGPLVLWDCVFPGDKSPDEDGMQWVYAGDQLTIASNSKTDGKFGNTGLVDHLWTQWKDAKLQETLTSGLLGLVLGQGDGTAFGRGGVRDPSVVTTRGQRVFDGSSTPRLAGDYVSVMQRPQMETLEVQNAKYAAGKKARRELKNGSNGS